MKRLIATIIIAAFAIAIAGCDVTYHHVRRYDHGPYPRAVIVTRPPVYRHGPYGHHRHYGGPYYRPYHRY